MNIKNRHLKFIGRYINGFFPFFFPYIHIVQNGNPIKGIFLYYYNLIRYIYLSKSISAFKFSIIDSYPLLYDRDQKAGEIPKHYFFQDIWAAKKVFSLKVKHHYDIGSRLDGFISHCLTFCHVTLLDIRPLNKQIDNLNFIKCDCTDMGKIRSGSIESLSSLHAVEHFGLGRYGDNIDPTGYIKVIKEMQRISKHGGHILFSVPIGIQKLEYNANRIFDPQYVIKLFDQCTLVEFSVVDDDNNLHQKTDYRKYRKCTFSCGLFHFIKK